MRKTKNKKNTKIENAAIIICFLVGIFCLYLAFTLTSAKMAETFTANPTMPRIYSLAIDIFDYLMIIIGVGLLLLSFQKKIITKYSDKILTLTTALVFCFFVGEIFAWVLFTGFPQMNLLTGKVFFEENQDSSIVPHHYLNYALAKNYENPLTGDRQNSIGFRGEEVSIEKPEGVFRIVTIGGSTTYGAGVKYFGETYPNQLQEILRKKFNTSKIEVINAGVGGYSSWESLINLEFKVLQLKPNLIIIYHAVNDVHSRIVNPEDYVADNSGARKQWSKPKMHPIFKSKLIRLLTPINSFSDIYGYIFPDGKKIAGVTSNDFNPKIGTTPKKAIETNKPVYFESNIKSMIGIARINNISVMLTTFATYPIGSGKTSFYQQGVKEHNDILRNLSDEFDTEFCDVKEEMPQDKEYFVDYVHLNKKGNFIKASIISECITDGMVVQNA